MSLKTKRIQFAKDSIRIIEQKNFLKNVGEDSPFMIQLREIAEGKDTAYTQGMRWIARDALFSDKELSLKLNDLGEVDFWYQKLKWLPWV